MFYKQLGILINVIFVVCFQTTPLLAQIVENKIDNDSITNATSNLVVFNADLFYVQDNSLSIKNGIIIVLNNKTIVDTENDLYPLQSENNTDTENCKPKLCKNNKKIGVAKPKSPQNTETQSTLIASNSSPFGNNHFYTAENNLAGTVPTTTSKTIKQACFMDTTVSISDHSPAKIVKKQTIQSSAIVYISSNYSKTSRIRPPPQA